MHGCAHDASQHPACRAWVSQALPQECVLTNTICVHLTEKLKKKQIYFPIVNTLHSSQLGSICPFSFFHRHTHSWKSAGALAGKIKMSRFASVTFASVLNGCFLGGCHVPPSWWLSAYCDMPHVPVGTDDLQMGSWVPPGISVPRVFYVLHHIHHLRIRKHQPHRCYYQLRESWWQSIEGKARGLQLVGRELEREGTCSIGKVMQVGMMEGWRNA